MAEQTRARSLEARRAERRRRERRRRKRIRALLLLICFIAIIVLIIIAFSSCVNRSKRADNDAENVIETTLSPEASPTAAPVTTVSGIPAPSEENDLLEIIERADANGGEKTCYLTFDDGPSEIVTASILDTLRRYNIKATFFEVGSSIETYPDMARRVYEEGHLIANHSQSHNYDKLYATEESFITEVEYTENLIAAVTGSEPDMKLFRFPGGSYNAGDHADEKQIYKGTLADHGFYYIDWNALNGDAEGKTKNAQELLEYVRMYIDTDQSAVVLMHDASAKKATAEALPSIIEYLMSEGYVFKRLDEIDYRPSSSASGSSTYGTSSDAEEYDDYDYNGAYEDNDYADEDDDDDYSASSSSASGGTILSTPSAGSTTRTSVNGTSVTEDND